MNGSAPVIDQGQKTFALSCLIGTIRRWRVNGRVPVTCETLPIAPGHNEEEIRR
jgi:hypothetical protein